MRKKLFKTTVCLTLIAITALTLSTSVFANNSRNDISIVSETFQEIGLSIELPVTSFDRDFITVENVAMPHIRRIAPDAPILIRTEADVDILLAFAEIAVEQEFSFSWDVCIDIALADAGLYDYWRAGFREITQAGRDQELAQKAVKYSFHELIEMGLFNRPGLLEEMQALGFFLNETLDPFLLESVAIAPFNVWNGTVPHQVLTDTWTSPIWIQRGDIISYSLTISSVTNQFPWPTLMSGLVQRGFGNVHLSRQVTTPINPMPISRTINNTATNANAFVLMRVGQCMLGINVNGSYRISR